MFVGECTALLDKNNRLVLPADFRKAMDPAGAEPESNRGFYVTIGFRAEWLELHPAAYFKKRTDGLYEKYPETNLEGRRYLRDVVAAARIVTLDTQNRFTLPEELKTRAAIESEVYFVANWDRIEIWNAGRYRAYRDTREGKQAPPDAVEAEVRG